MSVSGLVPLVTSASSSLDQNMAKSGSLMRCQTLARGAAITVDSLTEVEVGIREDMLEIVGGGGSW